MLRKLQKKLALTLKLWKIGADIPSSLILLSQLILLSLGRYTGRTSYPFSCRVQANTRATRLYCIGTMGELQTLVDIFADNSYAPLTHTSEENSIGSILDLGANSGIATIWFALSYPNSIIHAYEPNPRMFTLLKKNTAPFSGITAFEHAIAGTEGSVTFNQSEHFLESSIYAARDSVAISVPASTLDQAIKTIGGRVDYMKIDIEGAEFDAFASATTLSNVRAITGEAHTEQSGHAQEELHILLSSFNTLKIYNPNNDTVFGFYAERTT
jgi:FkbM family methyltransferase